MKCLIIICLYLKGYMTDRQFEDLFSAQLGTFQGCVEEDIYLDIIFTNFDSREARISLQTKLYHYVLQNAPDVYENINDVSIEQMIETGAEDELVQDLKKKYEKQPEICIDCGAIHTSSELIIAFKHALQFPAFCGTNWDAVEDLICDVIFPEKLIFSGWGILESRLLQDAGILRRLLAQYGSDRCVVLYE